MRHASRGRASTIGTIIASGGIGKIELSRKATMPRARIAWRDPACRIVQS
jgi:hypothetical protein